MTINTLAATANFSFVLSLSQPVSKRHSLWVSLNAFLTAGLVNTALKGGTIHRFYQTFQDLNLKRSGSEARQKVCSLSQLNLANADLTVFHPDAGNSSARVTTAEKLAASVFVSDSRTWR